MLSLWKWVYVIYISKGVGTTCERVIFWFFFLCKRIVYEWKITTTKSSCVHRRNTVAERSIRYNTNTWRCVCVCVFSSNIINWSLSLFFVCDRLLLTRVSHTVSLTFETIYYHEWEREREKKIHKITIFPLLFCIPISHYFLLLFSSPLFSSHFSSHICIWSTLTFC